MASFNGWGTSWGNSWGASGTDPNAMSGSASIAVNASGTLTALGNGAGKSLAEYEAEWAFKRAQEAIEKAQGKPAQVRRRIKREVAREVYFKTPAEVQAKADTLKAQREIAQLAEMRALLDLAATTSAAQAEIARIGVEMARRKKAEADAAIEEFDVMYIAAILAGA